MSVVDTLLTGGDIIDGTGAPKLRSDIGIADGRITYLGLSGDVTARETVDCRDMIITPGLIDPHSHSDWSILGNRDAMSTIHQGVTTEVVGNCGVTYAPLSDLDVAGAQSALRALGYDGPVDWRSFPDLLARVHSAGTAQNLMWFVGHTALRSAASGRAESDGTDEVRERIRLLEEAMEAGAIGLTSGLEYGAGRFAGTEELAELARVVARHDGMYASHIRNRDRGLASAVDEFFSVVETAGVRAQLSHLNVRHGTGAEPGAWERAVEQVTTRRRSGTDVLADMTPYPHGIGLAAGLLPEWLVDRPAADAAAMLHDPKIRQRVREDSDRYWRFVYAGQWDRVRLGVSATHPQWQGLAFPQIAEQNGYDEWDCLFDILAAAGPDLGGVQLMGELFTSEHVAEAVSHDHFLLGVDAYTACHHSALADRTRHPLFFYGHLHYLAHHVPSGSLTWEQAIHKMTGMVAEHFGIHDRGKLAVGAHADVVVFDPAIVAATDTWTMPQGYADAARHVWVNGVAVVRDAVRTSNRPGRQLKQRN